MSDIIENTKAEILLLYREAYFAKTQYIILKNIYNEYLVGNDNYKYVISTSFDAFEFSLLSKLTKIYDTDPDKQSITIFQLFNKVQSCKLLNKNNKQIKDFVLKILNDLKDKSDDIEKIKICRDKVVAHLDKKYPKGLLSMKANEQLNFELLNTYSDYAYTNIKLLYEMTFNEQLNDTKQFEILELEYKSLKDKFSE